MAPLWSRPCFGRTIEACSEDCFRACSCSIPVSQCYSAPATSNVLLLMYIPAASISAVVSGVGHASFKASAISESDSAHQKWSRKKNKKTDKRKRKYVKRQQVNWLAAKWQNNPTNKRMNNQTKERIWFVVFPTNHKQINESSSIALSTVILPKDMVRLVLTRLSP